MGKSVEELSGTLRSAILGGDLEPGARLRQDDLAARLGVSKIPLREALQRLAAEGLVTVDANRGFSVSRLTASEAEEIYALRLALEPELLQRALPRATIVDLARAEHALEADADATPAGNWTFHQALYGPSGWERGLTLVRGLHGAVAPYLLLYLDDPTGAAASAAQHREILARCQTRDAPGAAEVLRTHLRMAGERLVGRLTDAAAGASPV
ncbi:MAG: GntR family transcriptional regulator [Gemmatimonadota bacterium]